MKDACKNRVSLWLFYRCDERVIEVLFNSLVNEENSKNVAACEKEKKKNHTYLSWTES